MRIAEIFYSIQGEGSLLGIPSVFIRVSGCNLRCTWCDTPYTSWAPEGEPHTVDGIIQEVLRYPARHVVITGGEPMLFSDVVSLSTELRGLAKHITFETAGTVHQPVACDLMSISPKLANSTPHEREGGRWAARHDELRYQPAILERLMREYDYQLKFVIAGAEDLPEVRTIIHATHADPTRVILMPEGTTREAMQQRGPWLAELCKQEGFRYSPRLHVDLWGDKRGV
jgi:7-carboxy-7-deazaguanine synthase